MAEIYIRMCDVFRETFLIKNVYKWIKHGFAAEPES